MKEIHGRNDQQRDGEFAIRVPGGEWWRDKHQKLGHRTDLQAVGDDTWAVDVQESSSAR